MASSETQAKRRAVVTLRVLRFILDILAFISAFLICMSGTLMVDGDDGLGGFLWPSLSIVTFKGIIPTSSESTTYGIQFFWFLNALGWRYPTAAQDWHRLGYVYNIDGLVPAGHLALPQSLVPAAQRIGLDAQSWACVGDAGNWCLDPFFQDIANALPTDGAAFGTDWILYCYYAAFVMLGCTGWKRCRWPASAAATALLVAAAGGLSVQGWRVLALLGRKGVPEGMEARLGGGLVPLAWAACVASLIALLCGVVGNWVEDESARAGEQGVEAGEEGRLLLGGEASTVLEKKVDDEEDLLDFDPEEVIGEEGVKIEV